MIDGRAAGHDFKFGVCDCGKHLVDIQDVTSDDAGKPGIAHSGYVTLHEIQQIVVLANKMREKVNSSFGWRD